MPRNEVWIRWLEPVDDEGKFSQVPASWMWKRIYGAENESALCRNPLTTTSFIAKVIRDPSPEELTNMEVVNLEMENTKGFRWRAEAPEIDLSVGNDGTLAGNGNENPAAAVNNENGNNGNLANGNGAGDVEMKEFIVSQLNKVCRNVQANFQLLKQQVDTVMIRQQQRENENPIHAPSENGEDDGNFGEPMTKKAKRDRSSAATPRIIHKTTTTTRAKPILSRQDTKHSSAKKSLPLAQSCGGSSTAPPQRPRNFSASPFSKQPGKSTVAFTPLQKKKTPPSRTLNSSNRQSAASGSIDSTIGPWGHLVRGVTDSSSHSTPRPQSKARSKSVRPDPVVQLSPDNPNIVYLGGNSKYQMRLAEYKDSIIRSRYPTAEYMVTILLRRYLSTEGLPPVCTNENQSIEAGEVIDQELLTALIEQGNMQFPDPPAIRSDVLMKRIGEVIKELRRKLTGGPKKRKRRAVSHWIPRPRIKREVKLEPHGDVDDESDWDGGVIVTLRDADPL